MKPSDENSSPSFEMNSAAEADPFKLARRTMTFIFVVTLATVGLAVLCTKVSVLEAAIRNIELNSAETHGTLYEDKSYYQDRCERMVFEDIPQNDDAKPGIYVYGSSLVVHALRLWDAEPWVREFVHDRAVKGSNTVRMRQLCQYLVERGKKASADNHKKLMIFGIGYTSAIGLMKHHQVYFKHLWEDHHFYKYDEAKGIEDAPHSELAWQFRINRVRTAGFVNATRAAIMSSVRSMSRSEQKSDRKTKPNIERMKVLMGDNWQEKIDQEFKEIEKLIDYCQSEELPLEFVLMPMATWVEELPCEEYFNSGLKRICEEKGVRVQDLSRLVPDKEFVDSAHYTIRGAKLFTDKLAEIAKPFLIDCKAISPETTEEKAE